VLNFDSLPSVRVFSRFYDPNVSQGLLFLSCRIGLRIVLFFEFMKHWVAQALLDVKCERQHVKDIYLVVVWILTVLVEVLHVKK
jgi:hypothetical protein